MAKKKPAKKSKSKRIKYKGRRPSNKSKASKVRKLMRLSKTKKRK
jgi:hypothetical protein